MRPATTEEWVSACAEAWGRLCNGHDCYVEREKETWENAIVRVAGELLRTHELGRPRGEVPPEWEIVVEMLADKEPCSDDGLVEGPHGIRLGTRNLLRARMYRRAE